MSSNKSIKVNFFDSEFSYKIPFIGAIYSMTISSDGKYMATGSEDCSVKIFDLETKKELHHFPDNKDGISNIFE